MPDGTASIDRESGSVSFESCDPGPKADLDVTGKSGDALAYPAVRTDIVIGSLADGADPEDAGCFGTQVVSALSPSQLLGEDDYAESEEFLRGAGERPGPLHLSAPRYPLASDWTVRSSR